MIAEPELVVLLSPEGEATGTMEKFSAHHDSTPLHLAFSCYVFDDAGNLLVTQRALSKKVFPGVWTNSVCGHPSLSESLEAAAQRRGRDELGMDLEALRLVLPEFQYRAELDGIVEHEMCPVLVARAADQPRLNPAEVEDFEWVPWREFADSVLDGTREISPWCRLQVAALNDLGADPSAWPSADRSLLPPALRD